MVKARDSRAVTSFYTLVDILSVRYIYLSYIHKYSM